MTHDIDFEITRDNEATLDLSSPTVSLEARRLFQESTWGETTACLPEH